MRIFSYFKWLLILPSFSIMSQAQQRMGSFTGNIFMEEKADSIQMVKERVHISLQEDSSHVKCTFWLANYGSSKDITIGFDNYHRCIIFGTDSIQNFTCKVNGLPFKNIAEFSFRKKYKYKRPDDNYYIDERQWYTWEVHIEANDTIKIENEYDVTTWGGTLCEKSFHYKVGTGTAWAGSIGDGRITFDHSKYVSTNFVIKSLVKSNLKPVYYDDSVVYSFTNYTPVPHEALSIWIYSTSFFMDYSDLNPCLMRYIGSHENARMIRNEFFALHGYKFEDANLFDYYNKRKWYKVNPLFDTTRFSNGEKKVIRYLIGNENSYNAKKQLGAVKE